MTIQAQKNPVKLKNFVMANFIEIFRRYTTFLRKMVYNINKQSVKFRRNREKEQNTERTNKTQQRV